MVYEVEAESEEEALEVVSNGADPVNDDPEQVSELSYIKELKETK